MSVNLTVRRRDVARIISHDPWTITVYRRGRTGDDDESTITCTGRVQPIATQGGSTERFTNPVAGEGPVATQRWLLLAPYDTTALTNEDEVTAVQQSSGITHKYRVVYSARFAYKYEVTLDDRQ